MNAAQRRVYSRLCDRVAASPTQRCHNPKSRIGRMETRLRKNVAGLHMQSIVGDALKRVRRELERLSGKRIVVPIDVPPKPESMSSRIVHDYVRLASQEPTASSRQLPWKENPVQISPSGPVADYSPDGPKQPKKGLGIGRFFRRLRGKTQNA